MGDSFKTIHIKDLEVREEISNEASLVVIDSSDGKITPWSSVLNLIKTKLASWAYDILTTTNKTLPGAIEEVHKEVDELNTKIATYASLTASNKNITSTTNKKLTEISVAVVGSGYFQFISDSIKILKSGIYRIEIQGYWSAVSSATNVRNVEVYINDNTRPGASIISRDSTWQVRAGFCYASLKEGDMLSLYARDEAGNGTIGYVVMYVTPL